GAPSVTRLAALLSDVDGVFRTVPKAHLHRCVVESLLPGVPQAEALDANWVWMLSGSDAFVNETPDFLEFAAHAAQASAHVRAELLARASDPAFLQAYLASFRKTGPDFELEGAIRRFHALRHGPNGQTAMEPIPGALDGLQRILDSGIPFAFVSNSPRDSIQTWFSAHGFADLVILGEEDVDRQKPDPQGIQKACLQLGVLPSKNVGYAGDLPNDMAAARAAGVTALGIAYGDRRARLENSKPDFLFSGFQACAHWVLDDQGD
ncbi:MAG: HAD-IA family hydrolase, partial [Candidatus Micrarchaeota archaeon]|nr:HAD-IA family hydrolase [Candidatus Micrarchaeota archaeon]